jgi:hypothetical protein
MTAPDKLAALARIRRKLQDAKGAKDGLTKDSNDEGKDLKDTNDSLGNLNKENPEVNS